MSGDENKSLQQNLPLSWEEDSDNSVEDQAPPKKLLLKREEPQVEEAPKPLLLKKAPVSEDVPENDEVEYRQQLDNLDTIYDREIPEDSEEDLEEYDEDYELEESEWNDSEQDYQDQLAEETEDQEELEELEESSEDVGIDEEVQALENQEADLEEEVDASSEHSSEEVLEDEEDEEDEEIEDESSDYESAFQDSGTFTLDETVDEEDEVDDSPFAEDDIEENRIEISESGLSLEKEDSELEDETEESPAPTQEESVFALKADTFYEVQTESKSEDQPSLDETQDDDTPAEVIQDHEVQSLGALLQEARLACSFTIKDAAEATRIKSSYIIALENNEMDELPAKVYVLNYIRQLCREYNVANEPIIAAFERQSENNGNGSDVKIMRVGDEDARKATKPNSKLNALVVGTSLLTLIMLFLIGWYMKWFNTGSSPETIKIEVNLEEVRPDVKLPAPELPIPSQ